MKFPVATGDPGPPDAGPLTKPPVMVPIAVFWIKSKSSKSTAPGTEVIVVPGLLVTEMAFAGLTAKHARSGGKRRAQLRFHDASPLTYRRSRHQHHSHRVPSSISGRAY